MWEVAVRGYANAMPVTWKGVTYRSIAECARALGLTAPTIAKRLREGVPLDDPRKKGGAETIVVEGVKYASRAEAAKAYHLSSTAFRYRLEHHLPMTTPKRGEKCACVYRGVKYQDLQMLADIKCWTLEKARQMVIDYGKWL